MITFSALFLTNLIYSGYNTVSDNSRADVLDGLVSILVVAFFCFLGIYSRQLAFRLYTHTAVCNMLQFRLGVRGKLAIGLCCLLLATFMFIINLTTLNFMYSGGLGPHSHNSTNFSDPSIFDPTFDTIFNGPSINPCNIVILQIEDCQVQLLI